MGCNSSKEAVQAAAENGAAEKKLVTSGEAEEAKAATGGAVMIPEEVIPIDLSGPSKEVEKAKEAFGMLVKSEEINLEDPEANEAATKIQAAFRGHRARKSMKKEEETDSKPNLQKEFSPENKELCEAATKIQASFRGHLVRKSATRKEEEELSRELEKLNAKVRGEEELDIDLNDPDLQVAATKIQASFRGHRVRKEQQLESDE